MRWASWALGIVGVLQYAVILATDSTAYVSLDMAYLVMFLCIIGGLALCYASCWAGCGYGGGCGCCEDGCTCGDCGDCAPSGARSGQGHEGHDHGPGEHGHSH